MTPTGCSSRFVEWGPPLGSERPDGRPSGRAAQLRRETKETSVSLGLDLDGTGRYSVSTGIGMLDHMLEQLARHGLFDLRLDATGDIERDPHHLVEDVGLVLGQALDRALGERRGISRFGHAIVPMDEALAVVAVDLGGRPHATIDALFDRELIGQLPAENVKHFLEAFALEARMNLHVRLLSGENDHHRVEAIFKALARALRAAVAADERVGEQVPSTKEVL
jgi:imidazoleglycerol-phosphate dehydratase